MCPWASLFPTIVKEESIYLTNFKNQRYLFDIVANKQLLFINFNSNQDKNSDGIDQVYVL